MAFPLSQFRTKPTVAGLVGITFLLFIAVLFVVAHHLTPAITVHPVKSVQSGGLTIGTFQITNHTPNRYFVTPRVVEAYDGTKWKTCYAFGDPTESDLKPYTNESLTVGMTNLPAGAPLRLSFVVVKELRGLKGFPGMLRLRFIDKFPDTPLDPFDKYTAVGSHAGSLTSDEFILPNLRKNDQRTSEN